MGVPTCVCVCVCVVYLCVCVCVCVCVRFVLGSYITTNVFLLCTNMLYKYLFFNVGRT